MLGVEAATVLLAHPLRNLRASCRYEQWHRDLPMRLPNRVRCWLASTVVLPTAKWCPGVPVRGPAGSTPVAREWQERMRPSRAHQPGAARGGTSHRLRRVPTSWAPARSVLRGGTTPAPGHAFMTWRTPSIARCSPRCAAATRPAAGAAPRPAAALLCACASDRSGTGRTTAARLPAPRSGRRRPARPPKTGRRGP